MKIGDHLISPRIGYTHHGIYIGNQSVVHYSGSLESLFDGKIEIVSLDDFSNGVAVNVKAHIDRKYSREDSVEQHFLA